MCAHSLDEALFVADAIDARAKDESDAELASHRSKLDAVMSA